MRINPCPQVRWVPVVDSAGHRHMEMRWSMPTQVQPTAQPVTAPTTLRAAGPLPAVDHPAPG